MFEYRGGSPPSNTANRKQGMQSEVDWVRPCEAEMLHGGVILLGAERK